MNPIKDFSELSTRLCELHIHKRVVVVCAHDLHTQYAIQRAAREGFASFILVGDTDKLVVFPELKELSDRIKYVDVKDGADAAAEEAVRIVRCGEADILMKGIINTDNLLHAVLNKNHGLMVAGRVLSHLAVVKIPTYHKLLFIIDAAVIPKPTYSQFIAEIKYAVDVCNRFGISQPRIALLHCVEKVNSQFPHTLDYQEIVQKAKQGDFGDVIVDGPLDLLISCDKESAAIKGVHSPIDGEADVLVFPNIESGNVFYKSVSLFAKADMAGTLQGTNCPVIVTSRGDSGETKFNSLAMACLTSK